MSVTRRRAAWALGALAALLLAACAPSRAPGSPATATGPTPPAAAAPARPDAQAVESFYRGKTLRFITGFSAGGLFDNYTRAAARYLGKPTGTQTQSYAIAGKEFAAELAKLRALVETDLPALEKKLEGFGAPWTPGRLPVWDGK